MQPRLTKDFRETIRERAQEEPAFRGALLHEAIELMLSADVATGEALMRNDVNADDDPQRMAPRADSFRFPTDPKKRH